MQHFSVHRNTKAAIAAWHDMSGLTDSAGGSQMAPDYPGLTDGLFVLRRRLDQSFSFGAAGQMICRLMGQPMLNTDFSAIWHENDRGIVDVFVDTVIRKCGPSLMQASAETETGRAVRVEIMLAPLDPPQMHRRRLLGLYQPLTPLCVLEGRAVTKHSVTALHLPPQRRTWPDLRVVSSV